MARKKLGRLKFMPGFANLANIYREFCAAKITNERLEAIFHQQPISKTIFNFILIFSSNWSNAIERIKEAGFESNWCLLSLFRFIEILTKIKSLPTNSFPKYEVRLLVPIESSQVALELGPQIKVQKGNSSHLQFGNYQKH